MHEISSNDPDGRQGNVRDSRPPDPSWAAVLSTTVAGATGWSISVYGEPVQSLAGALVVLGLAAFVRHPRSPELTSGDVQETESLCAHLPPGRSVTRADLHV